MKILTSTDGLIFNQAFSFSNCLSLSLFFSLFVYEEIALVYLHEYSIHQRQKGKQLQTLNFMNFKINAQLKSLQNTTQGIFWGQTLKTQHMCPQAI